MTQTWLTVHAADWSTPTHDGCPHEGKAWLIDINRVVAVTRSERGCPLVYLHGLVEPIEIVEPLDAALLAERH